LWVDRSWTYLNNSVPILTPIGFNFKFYEFEYTNITIRNNGTAAFRRTDLTQIYNDAIYICFAKLASRTNQAPWVSSITYATENTPPNRVFKTEYNNVGFEDGDSSHFINFQLWLYESTNIIEVHFGPSSFDSSCWWYQRGAYSGLSRKNEAEISLLGGYPNSPSLYSNDTQLIGAPANGYVYRFIPLTTGLNKSDKPMINSYPNPAANFIEINTTEEILKIYVYDISGKTMDVPVMVQNRYATLQLNTLEKGMYIAIIETEKGIASTKILKE
jgi:hypothetical protein